MSEHPTLTKTSPDRENRLAGETSPYLLQHKNNPVDWRPWGPQALEEAQRANKPILLSVGYAACHWCHVMAHESFEDEATAAVMNELFVNIKVDREERPDIDQIYMSALHHLGEQGGWPLTMFLTPKGEPVWGGTYFPKTSRYGRAAFVDVLREVSRLFREEPGKIGQNRDALMERLETKARPVGKVVIGSDDLNKLALQIGGAFDPQHGGLRGAPKFPNASLYELAWRAGLRTGDERFFKLIEHTLEHICEGGIYDHLGGGFSRYSVDERWLVPHFEKMLYDNAQLLELLALAYQRSGNPLFRQRAAETVGWLAREMTTAEGAFSASLDADSEGEEGKYYVWSLAEVEQALGPDAALFVQHYDVTSEGNFEGHNILNLLNHLPRSKEDEAKFSMLRQKLFMLREKRIRPGLDDKVLADWNGLMIAALANAGAMLNEPDWIARADKAFDFIAKSMTRADRLGHSWREGKLLYPGLASDFACMIRAAIALYEATGRRERLDQALTWQKAFEATYANPQNGGYYLTASDAEGLVVRPASTADEATPNPNAIAAQNLLRLAALTGDEQWRERADRLFDGVLSQSGDNLLSHAALLNALDLRLNAAEIVVTGPAHAHFSEAALRLPYLNRIMLRAPSADALPAGHPAQAKIAAGVSAAFICVGQTCSLPVTDPAKIAEVVDAMRPRSS
ncbi:thioredoxin domain-containing protein [Rhodoplanes sp. Z2-YC6860]|uniref:thioredoxin domain-containing protein n=1 Tax=Rhodoplanes sp. Z2-YC6860 TaxID=674703 RepID=UPI00078B3E01|nr:thioredoxin domain-containing protein [Rhodoplanes sp. Z2-YC6860]AMN38707.1 Thymidylate kinase [Rhodoplanes sp. Z2-YC6860]